MVFRKIVFPQNKGPKGPKGPKGAPPYSHLFPPYYPFVGLLALFPTPGNRPRCGVAESILH